MRIRMFRLLLLVEFGALLIDFFFNLRPNARRILPQCLTRLVASLFVSDILPKSCFRVTTEESTLRSANFVDNGASY